MHTPEKQMNSPEYVLDRCACVCGGGGEGAGGMCVNRESNP